MRAKLVACFGLYLIVGMFYYAVFNLIQVIHPDRLWRLDRRRWRLRAIPFCILSLVTLTTVGYGDVVPVSRPARMFAVLEGMSGLFYMAVTVGATGGGVPTGETGAGVAGAEFWQRLSQRRASLTCFGASIR